MSKDKKIKYCLYARISNKDNNQQSVSIDSQINKLTNLSKDMGLNVVKTFVEYESAKKSGRSVFDQMIKDIEGGNVNGILCWDLDRLSRNITDIDKITILLESGVIQKIQTYKKTYLPSNDLIIS